MEIYGFFEVILQQLKLIHSGPQQNFTEATNKLCKITIQAIRLANEMSSLYIWEICKILKG